MSRLIDNIAAIGECWTAMSGLEVSEAIRVCYSCFDDQKEAGRALAAYMYIASKRNSETLKASVSDGEIASILPKLRGSGFLSANGYRKQIKEKLKAFGLLDYSTVKRNIEGGRLPTEYAFPMLETLLEKHEKEGSTKGITTNDYSDTQGNNLYINSSHPRELSRTIIPPSRDIDISRDEQRASKRGNQGNKQAQVVRWVKSNKFCHYCGSYDTEINNDGTIIRCLSCGTKETMKEWKEQERAYKEDYQEYLKWQGK